MNLNPSLTDSNHSVSFVTKSQRELYEFESPQIGFKSSAGNQAFMSKGLESFKYRFESPRPKIENGRFPTTSFWSIMRIFLLQRA